MGISIDKLTGLYTNKIINNTAPNKGEVKESAKKFDEILISANKTAIEEKQASTEISTKLSGEIKNTDNTQKVEKLSALIRDNAYEIDAQTIASKILFFRGEA